MPVRACIITATANPCLTWVPVNVFGGKGAGVIITISIIEFWLIYKNMGASSASHLIPSRSLGHRGVTMEASLMRVCHRFVSSNIHIGVEILHSVHTLMLLFQNFLCLSLLLPPSTVPWRLEKNVMGLVPLSNMPKGMKRWLQLFMYMPKHNNQTFQSHITQRKPG